MNILILIYFVLLYNYGRVNGNKIDEPKTCSEECPLNLLNVQESVVIDTTDEEHNFHKNCILKCISHYHAFTVTNDTQVFLKENTNLVNQITKDRNIVLILNETSLKSMFYVLRRRVKHSPWSKFFIIFLKENLENILCKNFPDSEIFNEMKKILDYIWRKLYIVNVIGYFPLICPNYYAINDNFTNAHNRTMKLFTNKDVESKLLTIGSNMTFGLMTDFPLRASIFERFPTAIPDCENIKNFLILKNEYSGGYCGLDGLIMAEVVSKFRFNLTLNRSRGHHSYGYVTHEGAVTGTLGNIVRGEVDIAFNSRFMTDYGTTGFQFLMHSSSDALCALVNRPDEIPLWLFPYSNIYDVYVWALLMCSLIVVGIFFWTIQSFDKNVQKGISKLHEIITDSIVMGTFGFSILRHKTSVILRASCFFSSMVFVATFQGHVNYAFTTIKYGADIKTLQDLYDSALIITTSPSIKALVEPPYNELQSALIDRMVTGQGNRTLEEILSDVNNAAMERRTDVLIEIQKYHTDKNGMPLFNVVEECFRTYYLSIVARPEFPFAEHVKVVIERLQAAGLPTRYYEWTRYSLGIRKPTQVSGTPAPRPTAPVPIQELRIAFILLLTGYIGSCLVLVIELRHKP